jgi:putative ABC transport system permease protein
MKLTTLIIREIAHFRVTFVVAILAVTAAVSVLVGELTLLAAHDIGTERIIADQEQRTGKSMAVLKDDYRKITKELGFNLLIMPSRQALADYYDEGVAAATMPEDYLTRLTRTDIVTVQHLFPVLERKVRWPEQNDRTLILAGIRGEVPYVNRTLREPIMVAVEPGTIVLGYELWNSIGVRPGDSVRLLGRTFRISTCHDQRGSRDDITAWIDLLLAQELLGSHGRISAILALKCHCAGNSIDEVRDEVAAVLPDTQVIEIDNLVVTRAMARDRAKATADSVLAAEVTFRNRLRNEYESMAAWLIPVMVLGSAILVGTLAFMNVRERRPEIAILRALGYRTRHILSIFLAKAVLIGAAGAVAGWLAGLAAGIVISGLPPGWDTVGAVSAAGMFALALGTAITLSVVSSWLPALVAERQDPAEILREG